MLVGSSPGDPQGSPYAPESQSEPPATPCSSDEIVHLRAILDAAERQNAVVMNATAVHSPTESAPAPEPGFDDSPLRSSS